MLSAALKGTAKKDISWPEKNRLQCNAVQLYYTIGRIHMVAANTKYKASQRIKDYLGDHEKRK